MDLGATICTPKKPACGICPWMGDCEARARGDAETFPRKAPKVEGKLRHGASFVVVRADGHVLVRSRPTKGLLGGMTEVPSTAWTHGFDEKLRWRRRRSKRNGGGCRAWSSTASRIFRCSRWSMSPRPAPAKTKAPAGMRWVALADLPGEALPNVMRKVVAHAGLL